MSQRVLRNHCTRVMSTRIMKPVPIRRVARMCFAVAGLPSLARKGCGFRISLTPKTKKITTTAIPKIVGPIGYLTT
jgi:hypothetical protein